MPWDAAPVGCPSTLGLSNSGFPSSFPLLAAGLGMLDSSSEYKPAELTRICSTKEHLSKTNVP